MTGVWVHRRISREDDCFTGNVHQFEVGCHFQYGVLVDNDHFFQTLDTKTFISSPWEGLLPIARRISVTYSYQHFWMGANENPKGWCIDTLKMELFGTQNGRSRYVINTLEMCQNLLAAHSEHSNLLAAHSGLASPKFAEIRRLKFATLLTGCHLGFRKMDGTVSDFQLLSPPKPCQFGHNSVTLFGDGEFPWPGLDQKVEIVASNWDFKKVTAAESPTNLAHVFKISLEPKWPLFWLERALFSGVALQK